MNPRLIWLIIVLMFLSMTGLIGIQIYWIRSAVDQREQQFQQGVYEAMNNAVYEYEKLRIDKEFDKLFSWEMVQHQMHKQLDSLTKTRYKKENIIYDVKQPGKGNRKIWKQDNGTNVFEQFSIVDPFGVDGSGKFEYILPDVNGDTAAFMQNVDEVYATLSENGEIFSEFFKEMLSGYISMSPSALDTILLDSIIGAKLHDQGINIKYNWGINDVFINKLTYANTTKTQKLTSTEYKLPLSVNPFNNQYFLMLAFPNKAQYLLKNLFFLLVASSFLIILIIFSFAYTITTIFKQKQLSEIKNDLVNNITHELKTPISTISLACQAMSDPDLKNSPLRDNYITMISEENNRLALLVENVLQSAVFEREGFRLKLKQVDLHARIDKAIASLSMQAKSKNVKIMKDLGATKYELEADEVMMTNLIFNLIDNAIKYCRKEDPKIDIITYNNDDYIEMVVKDNGIGISKDDQQRIFDKLYRVPTGNVHNVKGFGLGLSYVKSIVERHHGSIKVQSQLGEGSTFIVRLPMKQKQD
jgi:two-component system phosphate regulon sensor histidine kinase PhoR